MKTKTIIILSILFAQCSLAEKHRELKILEMRYQAQIDKHTATYKRELEKLKDKFTKAGNLEGANATVATIASLKGKPILQIKEKDPLDYTKWNLLGVDKQIITSLNLLPDGKILSTKYKKPTWRRVDQDTILFNYGKEQTYIIFYKSLEGMTGYNSKNGKIRHLQKK